MAVFRSILSGGSFYDRLIAGLGALVAIAVTAAVCSFVPTDMHDLPFIVAPLGASAVLVFAVPASPLAQPWPVIGGNVISTLVGVQIYHLVPNIYVAAGTAVGAAIILMSLLRCLHPPGGAAALTAVIGSQGVHEAGYAFAFMPVAINSMLLVALAILFHKMTEHSYPHRPAILPKTPVEPYFNMSDIDAAIEDMHDSFDISREDIEALMHFAERHAVERRGVR